MLFVDESGLPGDDLFALGGVALRAEDWSLIQQRYERALAPFGRKKGELKWADLRRRSPRSELTAAVYDVIATSPLTCFVVRLRPRSGATERPDLFTSHDVTYATALMFLVERYQRYLAREESFGTIVLDAREGRQDERLRCFYDRLRRRGTPYVELERIVDSLLLGPSHHSLGLQLADFVVSITRAAAFAGFPFSDLYERLLARFDRHPVTGAIEGVGLVDYPPLTRKPDPSNSKLFVADRSAAP